MTRGTFRIRAIALVAAYALALQGLLTAFVPLAAALPAEVLCSGQAAPSDGGGHEPDCASACAMLGGVAAPLPLGVTAAAVLTGGSAHLLGLPPAPRIAAPKGPQAARAPPIA